MKLYIYLSFSFSVYETIFITIGLSYNKYQEKPFYKIATLKHNLESSPIFNILSDEKCENKDISNILGYFYGFDFGYVYKSKFYPGYKGDECYDEFRDIDCRVVKPQQEIPYKFYKGKRLCTSKRPNKNYFDYLKSSVGLNEICQKGLKICGKLDKNRILCVKIEEDCPINDIVYNNQSKYINNSITYSTIKINEEEFLHYTNEQINNFIITNLTVIGKYERGYPYGSDNNNETEYISPMDKIPYSYGFPKEFKLYFYKYLSSVNLRDFFLENYIYEIYEFYFENFYNLGRMSLFSTGYFSLSENDIKKLKDLSGLNSNENYRKIMSKLSLSGYILYIIFGVFMFIGALISLNFEI